MGPDEVDKVSKKIGIIGKRLQAFVDRPKKYAKHLQRPLEFEVGDLFQKAAPMRGVMRFGKKGKLSQWYVSSFEIIERIDEAAYRLAYPPALSKLHDVINISMLKKYLHDPSHVLSYNFLDVDSKLMY